MKRTVLEGHFDNTDYASDRYPLLPFRVPPGIARLHVRYEVSRQLGGDKAGWQEGNIVDIGLFDPRGAEFLTAKGFRGWSGTKRREFAVAADDATPGYLPGRIQPGLWHIVLGLYQLAPEGCDYRVTVSLEEENDTAQAQRNGEPDRRSSTATDGGPRWYRGDLHAHTHHSDGSAPLTDLAAAARAQGLDFVAVTEHNTVSHLPILPTLAAANLLLIPGVEISTYHGHANVWPIDRFVEFRCQNDDQMARVREVVRSREALLSINHPKEDGPPWRFGDLFEPDCMEIWGAPWIVSNYQSLAAWDAQLRLGKRITGVGGSDKHQGPFTGELGWYEIGTPCTWVYADALSTPAIIAGLRAGRVFVSEGPAGPHLELAAETDKGRAIMGDELRIPAGAALRLCCRVRGGAGNLLRLISAAEIHEEEINGDDFSHQHSATVADDTYWRAEVIEPPEVPLDEEPAALMAKALGNPIYVRTT
jgi:hypothetical protein